MKLCHWDYDRRQKGEVMLTRFWRRPAGGARPSSASRPGIAKRGAQVLVRVKPPISDSVGFPKALDDSAANWNWNWRKQMKILVGAVLFTCVCGGLVLAESRKAPSNDLTDVASVKQIEQDMGDAMVTVDIDRLNQIYADDFATIGSSGKIITKDTLLTDFKSFHDKLESFENGPMDVQVVGNVAVAHGSVTERRTRDGKDTSGRFVWMDLLEKRGSKWVVTRSAGARVK